jgi:2',3'-cyclic-nucleotide 2'-phosphodiesterase (5'-nucleotidase family)
LLTIAGFNHSSLLPLKFVSSADSEEWTSASIAIFNPRGIRTTLTRGEVTYSDLVSVIPFENNFNIIEIPGSTLRQALEHSVSNLEKLAVLQVSGVKVTYDLKREPNDRIVEINVLCHECMMPRYAPLDDAKSYRVIMPSFIAKGGDGFTMFPMNTATTIEGLRDIDALVGYIEKNSPISKPPTRSRINFL